MLLLVITRLINYIVLALALWLGLYVVTRNPRRLISWLTGLTLWSIASLSLSVLLSLEPPPKMTELPFWFQLFLPIWQMPYVEQAASSWLNGWSITPTIVLWHHITTLMRPGPLTWWRWLRILAPYGVLIIAIYIQAYTPYLFTILVNDPLYMPTLIAGPLYIPFLLITLLWVVLTVINLIRSTQSAPTAMPQKQFNILTAATLVAGLTGPFAIASSVFSAQVPIVILSVFLGCAVGLIGFGVANYGALIEGRTIRRDFIYNGVTVAGISLLYLAVTWFSVTAYQIPGVAFVYVFMLTIVTHSLVDVVRQGLDSLFFRQDTRRLRADLQRLTMLAGEQDNLQQRLSLTLETLCRSVRATYGLIIRFNDENPALIAGYYWYRTEIPLGKANLEADDVMVLEPGHFPDPLAEAALLIPLYADANQCGVLLLGRPINGLSYAGGDIEFLLYPSDRIAEAMRATEREQAYLSQIAKLAAENEQQRSEAVAIESPQINVKDVEKSFRYLSDFAKLGENPLATLELVKPHLPDDGVTHIDRGKGVHQVLLRALEKLRPNDEVPGHSPGREWYPYLILYRAYVEDIPNRDIMQSLYISEGTFNRTRRAALRAVTRSLEEMEGDVKLATPECKQG